jgi:hypothetical protein
LTAIEFGVADGAGMLDICAIARDVSRETGVAFDIVGFDTGTGLPPLKDHRDHPEIWSQGDFATVGRDAFEAALPANARMYWGDVANTLDAALAAITADAPVGFVSHDMDIYSATRRALDVYAAPAEKLLPVGIAYFDDTLGSPVRIGSLMRNRWAGQLLAIDEFNAVNTHRKVDVIRTLKYRRPLDHEQWLEQIYGVHILDHPARNKPTKRESMDLRLHSASSRFDWPL